MKKLHSTIAISALLAMAMLTCMPISIPIVEASPDPLEMLVYALATPSFNLTELIEIFGIPDPIIEDVDGVYVVNSSTSEQYLEVYQASGSIWYADWSKMYDELYERDLGISPENASSMAEEFLNYAGLMHPNASLIEVSNTTTTTLDETNATATIENSLDVIFGFEVENITGGLTSVDGPGAKIRVSIGEAGPPIGVHYVWREVGYSLAFPAIDEAEAVDILRERFKVENKIGLEIEITQSRLAYYAEPESLTQGYLQPYYIFDGVVLIDGNETTFQTQKIPATSFSPSLSIDSPKCFDRFLVNEAVTFQASVLGGGGIYSYEWHWNGTIIGTTATFSDTFPCSNIVKEGLAGLTPYTIALKVTDNNGSIVTDFVTIIVTVLMGDINGDWKVDMKDIGMAAKAFGSFPGNERWDLMADLNNDDKVDMKDIGTAAKQFGLSEPKPSSSSSTNYAILLPCILLLPIAVVSTRGCTREEKKKRLAGLLLAIVVICAFMTSIPSVVAQPNDDPITPKEPGVKEVGLESCGQNLANFATSSSNGFKNTLVAAGWTVRFHWYEWAAWEEDFKYRNGPDAIPSRGVANGGTDYYNGWPGGFPWWCIDAVDFAYYVGHGSPWGITFLANQDFRTFWFTNARWGGTAGGNPSEEADLEWIALESCKTLRWQAGGQNVFARWRQAFCGLHYVLGFHTVAYATMTFGQTFARYMTRGWLPLSVRRAWIRATQVVQPRTVRAAYLRAGNLPYKGPNDTYWDRIKPWRVASDPSPWSFLAYCSWQC